MFLVKLVWYWTESDSLHWFTRADSNSFLRLTSTLSTAAAPSIRQETRRLGLIDRRTVSLPAGGDSVMYLLILNWTEAGRRQNVVRYWRSSARNESIGGSRTSAVVSSFQGGGLQLEPPWGADQGFLGRIAQRALVLAHRTEELSLTCSDVYVRLHNCFCGEERR